MIKKILAIALISFASTSVMAAYENAKMVKLGEGTSDFSIEPSSGSSLPFSTCYLLPRKPTTIVYYVYKYRKSVLSISPVVSDPVMLDCNGVRTLINPGSSATCTLAPQEGRAFNVCYTILRELNHNGADGFTVSVDE